MPTPTYDLIASGTYSGTTQYSITGIPSGYADIVVIYSNFFIINN